MRLDLEVAMNTIGLSRKKLFDLLCVPADLRHWLMGKTVLDTKIDRLPNEVNQRLISVSYMIDELRGLLGSAEDVHRWFNCKNPVFGGLKPKQVIFDGLEGIQCIRDFVRQIEHGIYS